MEDSSKNNDEKKGDEVLRRMLKTPPEPKTLPKPKPGKEKERGHEKPET
jgi:hypothetical protein